MGKRGPLPTPIALRVLSGNASKRQINASGTVTPVLAAPSAPAHLSDLAKREWKRISPLLLELRLISHLDRTALELYCEAYAAWVTYSKAFAGKVKAKMDAGKPYEVAYEEASTDITPKGHRQQSVLLLNKRSAEATLNSRLDHFGLSPATRARVQPIDVGQLGLPGMEAKPGFQNFANG